MGIVTDIQKQKRNPSRVSIFIDGEFACGLDAAAALASRIKVGDEISREKLVAAMRMGELNSAFERAAGYLSLPRAEKEMRKYLFDKGYVRDVIDETIKKLYSYGYLDDRAYARAFISAKSAKYGKFRLSAELKKKGVDSEIIDELLGDENEDGIDGVARKYLRSHCAADRQKLKRFLSSRGFSWDAIAAEVSALADEGIFDGDGFDGDY